MSRQVKIMNVTRDTLLAEHGELANKPWSRFRGLLGRPGLERGQGLVIKPCQSIHTWFMQFPIDVLHVDGKNVVRRVITDLAPYRFGPLVWQSRYVVELPAGAARASGTEVGDELCLA